MQLCPTLFLLLEEIGNIAALMTSSLQFSKTSIQILSHLLTCKLLKSLSFFTSKTIFCDFSANKTIKYTLMFK